MSVLNREEFISRITARLGDDSSDEALAFMEDMSDTFDDMSSRLSDSTDWKTKYEENDKAWRDRYIERFASTKDDNDDAGEPDVPPKSPKTFDDLFTQEG